LAAHPPGRRAEAGRIGAHARPLKDPAVDSVSCFVADRKAIHPDSVPGDFFVDRSCIDCGTCYELTPEVFAESADHARVQAQPADEAAVRRAEMALVACPTGSIGTHTKHDLSAATSAFPERFEDHVYFCGFTSRDSFGAWSWLIERPGGNVLVDSPRANRALIRRIEEMGGVRWLVLTHGDDIADHDEFAKHFGCERVMHAADIADFGVTGIEHPVSGDDPVALADDLLVIPTPGHTRGHDVLLHDRWLFSGDHLWGSGRGYPTGSRTHCWYSWERQLASIERLLGYRFSAILPAHGPVHRAPNAEAMRDDLERGLAALRARERSPTQ
jgi:glyoxylase-like metal-dependent hydrolase (beta-lactamase superfamily II)/ferredoxin